ncbi:hypothetical protein GV819_17085 [Pseudomonas sp. Fl5BN2]|uniref:hypothetical protein n=1 Tax=unclassified Pseudomonas TaxID=196821 RepID=UPI00137682F2|nr:MULTISPECIES: hypothetical protein [unclassified Pseudomonas]NBF04003.1 hypothetical protein [Pseudomonas sp. Fl5BN2]NBF09751.1 hypothetical protein [Pseudomonas sp. Fl4BN1]
MENQFVVQRVIVAFLIIIVALGSIAFIGCLASPPGFVSGIRMMLAIMALGLTCLLCYPLVITYWIVSGRPTGIRDLLIVHSIVLGGFVVWYLLLLFE